MLVFPSICSSDRNRILATGYPSELFLSNTWNLLSPSVVTKLRPSGVYSRELMNRTVPTSAYNEL